jgi:hypothetical protein
MHGQSKHGLVWSAVLTLSFAGLAVAFFGDGAQLGGYGYGVLALIGLIGLVVRIARRQEPTQDQGSSLGPE